MERRQKTYSYTYGNTWKDQLTSFDGQSVIYDASGNPTSYMGATLAWNKGRLLTQYSNENKLISMQYDADGIRRSRLTEAREELGIRFELTDFLYDSQGRLRTESDSIYTRHYLYSNDGIIGFEEDGENYLYRKNLFGDITAIYHGSTKVAEYVYDAWGNCTITYDPDGIGARNPFRYRGYYWDNDIQMYYLMTRYYDPKTGRFINADSIKYLEPKILNGLNLYSYCNNNPIMNVDPSGHEPISIDDITNFVSLLAVATWLVVAVLVLGKKIDTEDLNQRISWNAEAPNIDTISPSTIDIEQDTTSTNALNGYGLEGFLYKINLFLDEEKSHSLYLSFGNIGMYAGVDLKHGVGIKGSISGAELGYDGRIIDVSFSGLTCGLGLIYLNGKIESDCELGLVGFSLSIDFAELINIFSK